MNIHLSITVDEYMEWQRQAAGMKMNITEFLKWCVRTNVELRKAGKEDLRKRK